MSLTGYQINPFDPNFQLENFFEIFDKNSAYKIWSKNDKEIKVSPLMPIRVNRLLENIVQGYRFAHIFRTLIDLKWLAPTKFKTVPLGLQKPKQYKHGDNLGQTDFYAFSHRKYCPQGPVQRRSISKNRRFLDITLTPFRQFISPSAIAVPPASGCSATVKDAGR